MTTSLLRAGKLDGAAEPRPIDHQVFRAESYPYLVRRLRQLATLSITRSALGQKICPSAAMNSIR